MNTMVSAKKKWTVLALALTIALAAGLRLFHLGVQKESALCAADRS
ncbi:MAG: hypothetical protein Q7J98_14255 [Kiritimatiellia bacterium]|nr:hypothetical protein [Kiritimatiellia bacterium]